MSQFQYIPSEKEFKIFLVKSLATASLFLVFCLFACFVVVVVTDL